MESEGYTNVILEESQSLVDCNPILPARISPKPSTSTSVVNSAQSLRNAVDENEHSDSNMFDFNTQLTEIITPLSLNMVSTQAFQEHCFTPTSNNNSVAENNSPPNNDAGTLTLKCYSPSLCERLRGNHSTEEMGTNSPPSQQFFETQLTQTMDPLTLAFVSTQDFRPPIEQTPVVPLPSTPKTSARDQTPSTPINASENVTLDSSPAFETQLTQEVPPLSLEFIATLEFATVSSKRDPSALPVPSCLRHSVFGRPIQDKINENNNLFLMDTQLPSSLNSSKEAMNESILMHNTQMPLEISKPSISPECAFTGNVASSSKECTVLKQTDILKKSSTLSEEESIFLNETQCPPPQPVSVSKKNSKMKEDYLDKSRFFDDTECLAPRIHATTTQNTSSRHVAENIAVSTDEDGIFFDVTQCPKTIDVTEKNAQTREDYLDKTIFLDETQCPNSTITPLKYSSPRLNESVNEGIFLNETQCPASVAIPLRPEESPKVLKLNESIFLNETQCPSAIKSPACLVPGNANITPRRKKKTVRFNSFDVPSTSPKTHTIDKVTKSSGNDSIFFAATQLPEFSARKYASPTEERLQFEDNTIFLEATQLPDYESSPARENTSIFMEATQLPSSSSKKSTKEPSSSKFLEANQLPSTFSKKFPEEPSSSIFLEATQLPSSFSKKFPEEPSSFIFLEATQLPSSFSKKFPEEPSCSIFLEATQLPGSICKISTEMASNSLDETQIPEATNSVFFEETQVPEFSAPDKPCSDSTKKSGPISENIFLESTQIPKTSCKNKTRDDPSDDDDMFLAETQVLVLSEREEKGREEAEPIFSCNKNSIPLPSAPSSARNPKVCQQQEDLSAFFEEPFDYDAPTQLPQVANPRTSSPNMGIESDSEVDNFMLSSNVLHENDETQATQLYEYGDEVCDNQNIPNDVLNATPPVEPEGDDCAIVLSASPDLLHTQSHDFSQASVIYVSPEPRPHQPTQYIDSDTTDSDVQEEPTHRNDSSIRSFNETPTLDGDSTDSDVQEVPEAPIQLVHGSDSTVSYAESSNALSNTSTESISLVGGDGDCPEYQTSPKYSPLPPRLQLRLVLNKVPDPCEPGPSRTDAHALPSETSSRPKRTMKPTMKAAGEEMERLRKRRGRNQDSRNSTMESSGSEAPSPLNIVATSSRTVTTRSQKTSAASANTPKQSTSHSTTKASSDGGNHRVSPLRLRRSGRISAKILGVQDSQSPLDSQVSIWHVSPRTPAAASPSKPSSSGEVIPLRRGRPRKVPAISSGTDTDDTPAAPTPRPVTRELARKRRRRYVGVIRSDDDTP